MTEQQSHPVQERKAEEHRDPPRTIDAQQLFQGDREIWIEHAGVHYRLRITRRNKLILQK